MKFLCNDPLTALMAQKANSESASILRWHVLPIDNNVTVLSVTNFNMDRL